MNLMDLECNAFSRDIALSPQQRWGSGRRSCPPPYGLLLDLTLARTPAPLLRQRTLAIIQAYPKHAPGLADGVSVRRRCSRLPQSRRPNHGVNETTLANLK